MLRSSVTAPEPPAKTRPIRVVFETNEPLHYNAKKTAERLGMSKFYLLDLAKQKVDGRPTVYAPCGKFGNDNIYHAYQIALISLVMRKKLTLAHASQIWRSFENKEVMDAITGGRNAEAMVSDASYV